MTYESEQYRTPVLIRSREHKTLEMIDTSQGNSLFAIKVIKGTLSHPKFCVETDYILTTNKFQDHPHVLKPENLL